MGEFAGLRKGPAAGAAVVALAAIAAVFALWPSGQPEERPAEETVSVQTAPDQPESQTAPDQPVPADVEPAAAPVPQPETEQDRPPVPPSVDTFRLDPDGNMLVAGRTEPEWETFVLVDGETLAQVTPESSGSFVSFLTLDHSDQPRVLSLLMRKEGAPDIASRDEIIIAPMLSAQVAQAEERQSDPSGVQTGGVALDATVDISDAAGDAPAPDEDPAAAPLAEVSPQAVLRSSEQGVEVIQPAPVPLQIAEGTPEIMSSVALDAITYSAQGEVQLTGRGQGDGFVRVYIDNAPIASTRIAPDGSWRMDLPEVKSGIYTLRVDEMAEDGTVLSRMETPFKREEAALVAESRTPEAAVDTAEPPRTTTRVSAVTVQPGSTLWAISRERYGEGLLYVRVFEANRDRIRDPDLIYPGQVFTLPE